MTGKSVLPAMAQSSSASFEMFSGAAAASDTGSSRLSAPALRAGDSTASGVMAPYIFDSAYASYILHYGTITLPVRMTIHDGNQIQRKLSGDTVCERPSRFAVKEFYTRFQRRVELSSAATRTSRDATTCESAVHHVRIFVPAGSFLTEETNDPQLSTWYDIHTGIMAKMQGRALADGLARDLPSLPRSDTADIELVSTNVPSKL
jgi:hypothetical protein